LTSDRAIDAIAAIRAGEVVVLPTDTVYGLAATAFEPAGRDALYRLKRRVETQPTALVAPSVGVLLELVPELRGRSERSVRALLPGPFTLVLPNPARRFGWLCGSTPDAIGVRVPVLAGEARDVLDAVEAVVATSANLPGGAEPRRLEDVPVELRNAAAAVVDGGELPGRPSTVLDLTGHEPRILREGAGDVAVALDTLSSL
jgi:L-threonylcarbamoyladenylate synthase